MVGLIGISRPLAKLNKSSICISRHVCRFHTQDKLGKPKSAHSVSWSIYGSNSPYSSVNATLHAAASNVAFNCGEGLQRLMSEIAGKHTTTFQHIFVTRLDWRCVAGLPGLLLSMNNRGAKQLHVYGPSTLSHLCDRIMQNIPKRGFEVSTVNCANGYTLSDAGFRIQAVPLRNATENDPKVIAYAGDIAAYQSRVKIYRCVDLNVTEALLISQLSNGLDVTLEDGSVVRPRDVTDSFPALRFLVVDIPSVDYIHHLEDPQLLLHADGTENTIFHLAPPSIIASKAYQNYMRKFPVGSMHVTTNNRFSGHVSPHKHQTLLNHVHGQIFPVLGEEIDDALSEDVNSTEQDCRIEDCRSNRIFKLRPINQIADHLQLLPSEWLEDLTKHSEAIETFHKLHAKHAAKYEPSERLKEYPKIVFLGTGASCPDKSRNVAGILVRLSSANSVLLDCGEGTLGQLYRFYGDKTNDILATLKAIFVSHMHVDHYMGVFNLLRQVQEMQRSNGRPVAVIGPTAMKKRLELFDFAVQNVSKVYEFVHNGRLLSNTQTSERDRLITDIGLVNIETCFVKHIGDSYGVSLAMRQPQTESVFKLTYSGDTTPCSGLVAIGKNSTVLIHEATLEDDLALSADHKKHSTVSQAIGQGNKMNAKHIILTHFSQRYRLPRLTRPLPNNVTIAFDNMELVESDLSLSHHLYEVLRCIYHERMDEADAKAEKRNYWKGKKLNKS